MLVTTGMLKRVDYHAVFKVTQENYGNQSSPSLNQSQQVYRHDHRYMINHLDKAIKE